LLEQFSAAPGKPIPAACGDWAATKAAYRFFDNPRVTEHGILAGHFAATAARVCAPRRKSTGFVASRIFAPEGTCRPTRLTSTRSRTRSPSSKPTCARRRHGPIDALWEVIRDALDTFIPQDCANYFAAAGYEPE
jgi:hypothetical protein